MESDEVNIYRKRFKFENLSIRQISILLPKMAIELHLNFLKLKNTSFLLKSRRAVDSVLLNIAEGAVGLTHWGFIKRFVYSIRSLAEVVPCLYKAQRKNYIPVEIFDLQYSCAFALMNKLAALKKR